MRGPEMTIRKFGAEPAKVDTRVEDNDVETLSAIGALPPEVLDTIDRAAKDENFGVRRGRPLRKTEDES